MKKEKTFKQYASLVAQMTRKAQRRKAYDMLLEMLECEKQQVLCLRAINDLAKA